MIPATEPVRSYRCPGESSEIPHPVHLARQASGFARCRDCEHRDLFFPEIGASGDELPRELCSARSLFKVDGVRGIYLNELDRAMAGRIAAAFASTVLDESGLPPDLRAPDPPTGAGDPADTPLAIGEGVTVLPSGRPGPIVVLAQDERPAAPDLVMGVGVALRRMGCQVVDIGPVTRPALWFAIDHLAARAGVHVTGAGCDPAWIGMDFVREGVLPCSRGGDLERIEERFQSGHGRPSRRAGSQRLFSVMPAYEAGLWMHFHALRPLRIALGCPNRILRALLERLFRKVACRLLPVEIPTRARNLADPRDPDLAGVARAVREQHAHLGLLIDDDAQSCAFFDETGARAGWEKILQLLVALEREADPAGRVAVEPGGKDLPAAWEPLAAEAAGAGGMSQAVRAPGVVCGGGPSGRFWFAGSYPRCDAALTFVRLLHVLSRRDTPFSEVLSAGSLGC
jgi:phosphomannomutase